MGNTVSSASGESLYDRQTFPRSEKKLVPKASTIERTDNSSHGNGQQESSRMLFLMYLIHRTWNVVVDGKGGKRWVVSFWWVYCTLTRISRPKNRNWKRGSIQNEKGKRISDLTLFSVSLSILFFLILSFTAFKVLVLSATTSSTNHASSLRRKTTTTSPASMDQSARIAAVVTAKTNIVLGTGIIRFAKGKNESFLTSLWNSNWKSSQSFRQSFRDLTVFLLFHFLRESLAMRKTLIHLFLRRAQLMFRISLVQTCFAQQLSALI